MVKILEKYFYKLKLASFTDGVNAHCDIFQYIARRLIGSWIIESADYCNQILPALLYISNTQNTSVNSIIIVITFMLAQSDPIKRWTLYFTYHGFLAYRLRHVFDD